MKQPYSIRIFFDPRDEAWVAVSDDLPGCSAGGDTPAEALKEFEVAVDSWLEALQSMKKPVPRPAVLREGYEPMAPGAQPV